MKRNHQMRRWIALCPVATAVVLTAGCFIPRVVPPPSASADSTARVLFTRAMAALDSANSFRMSAFTQAYGVPVTMDVSVSGATFANKATFTPESGLWETDVIAVNTLRYIRGTDAYWVAREPGLSEAELAQRRGRYVKQDIAGATDDDVPIELRPLSIIADARRLVSRGDKYEMAEVPGSADSSTVVILVSIGGFPIANVWVPTVGTPYPSRLDVGNGVVDPHIYDVTLTGYGAVAAATAPPDSEVVASG